MLRIDVHSNHSGLCTINVLHSSVRTKAQQYFVCMQGRGGCNSPGRNNGRSELVIYSAYMHASFAAAKSRSCTTSRNLSGRLGARFAIQPWSLAILAAIRAALPALGPEATISWQLHTGQREPPDIDQMLTPPFRLAAISYRATALAHWPFAGWSRHAQVHRARTL